MEITLSSESANLSARPKSQPKVIWCSAPDVCRIVPKML